MVRNRLARSLAVALNAALLFANDDSRAQSTESADAASEARESITEGGVEATFPASERAAIERILPKIRAWRRESVERIAGEVAGIESNLTNDAEREQLESYLATALGLDELDEETRRAFRESRSESARLTGLWRRWRTGFHEVRFWSRSEVLERHDPTSDAFVFEDLRYDRDSAAVEVRPRFLEAVEGPDDLPRSDDDIAPLSLDIPLMYRRGAPVEAVAASAEKMLQAIDVAMLEAAKRALLTLHLAAVERAALRWAKASLFPREEHERFAQVLARNTGCGAAIHVFGSKGAMRSYTDELVPDLPPDAESRAALASRLAAMTPSTIIRGDDPLREPLLVMRDGLLFSLLTMVGEGNTSALRLLADAGETIPADGLTPEAFVATVTRVAIESETAATPDEALAWYRGLVAKALLAAGTADVRPGSTAVEERRRSSEFEDLSISYPDDMADLVERAGARLAMARERITEAAADSPPKRGVELPEDLAGSIEALGFRVPEGALRTWTKVTDALRSAREPLLNMLAKADLQIWRKRDIREHLEAGGTAPGFRYDREADELHWSLELSIAANDDRKLPALPIVLDEEFETRTPEERLRFILEYYEKALPLIVDQLVAQAAPLTEKRALFFVAHEAVEMDLGRRVIRSHDRRWFCDGLATWAALRICETHMGEEEARRLFEALNPTERMREARATVDMFAWPTAEDIDAGRAADVESGDAHYYWATRVMEAALKERGADFVSEWLAKIAETPMEQRDAETVIAAFDELTGEDLRAIAQEVLQGGAEAGASAPPSKPGS